MCMMFVAGLTHLFRCHMKAGLVSMHAKIAKAGLFSPLVEGVKSMMGEEELMVTQYFCA